MTAEYLCIAVLNMAMPNAEYACEQMEHVVNAAEDLSFQPEILVALIHYERRWTPRAISSGGAFGLIHEKLVDNYYLPPPAFTKELKCCAGG